MAGQPIQISYNMTKERLITPSGLTKKRTLEQEFYKEHNLASELFLFNSLSAKSILAGEKLVATYSTST